MFDRLHQVLKGFRVRLSQGFINTAFQRQSKLLCILVVRDRKVLSLLLGEIKEDTAQYFLAIRVSLVIHESNAMSVRINVSQWIVQAEFVFVQGLWICQIRVEGWICRCSLREKKQLSWSPCKLIRTCEATLSGGIVPGQEVIKSCLNVPFFLGELLPRAVSVRVTHRRQTATGVRKQLFAKRQVIMTGEAGERAAEVGDHARRTQLIRYQPVNVC